MYICTHAHLSFNSPTTTQQTGAYHTHLPSTLSTLSSLPTTLAPITDNTLDARLLTLLSAAGHNPLWPLLALAFLTQVYLPLRWWVFRGLYIYGTAAVSLGCGSVEWVSLYSAWVISSHTDPSIPSHIVYINTYNYTNNRR